MKQIFQINLAGLTLVGFFILFFYSCKRDKSDCSKYQLTQQEAAILSAYNQGDIAVFKNDTTGVFDTLHVANKGYGNTYENDPICNSSVNDYLFAQFISSHLAKCTVGIRHNLSPTIINDYCEFPLNGSLQTMIINSTTYNDVFITSVDSTTI